MAKRNSKGQYPGGYPSVTTVCSMMSKGDGLLYWAAKVGWHESRRILKEAGDRGTRVHSYISKRLLSKRDSSFSSFNEADRQYVLAYEKLAYRTRPLAYGAVFPLKKRATRLIELTVFSRKFVYAGTFDGLITYGDSEHELADRGLQGVYLTDWKTSSDFRDDYAMQTAAYAIAIEETFGIPADSFGRRVVLLGKDGNFRVRDYPISDLKSDFQAFLSCLYLYNKFGKRS